MHDNRESAICPGFNRLSVSKRFLPLGNVKVLVPLGTSETCAWDQRGCRAGWRSIDLQQIAQSIFLFGFVTVHVDRKWLDFWDQCWTRCKVVKKKMRELPPSSCCWSWFLLFDGHKNSVQSSIFGRSHLRILLKPWQMMYFHPKKITGRPGSSNKSTHRSFSSSSD